MASQVIRVGEGTDSGDNVARAVEVLDGGGLVAFPTETVYGLGARADLPAALAKLRAIKQRTADQPFTLHLGTPEQIDGYVTALSPLARRLIRKLLPGPVTLILDLSDPTTAPRFAEATRETIDAVWAEGTIGIRCPSDPIAQYLLSRVSGPVAASSANPRGMAPPRTGDEALSALQDLDVDVVLAGGHTRYAKASTIVRIQGEALRVVREGVLDQGVIERLALLRILFVCSGNTCRSPMAEGLARQVLAERVGCRPEALEDRRVIVQSAGTSGGFGGASPQGVRVLAERGIDISGHISRHLAAEDLNQADHIFVMTRAHLEHVRALAPEVADRAQLLMADEDVVDPIGGTDEDYARCAAQIEKGVVARLSEVEL